MIVNTIVEIRNIIKEWKANKQIIGLVPTMGALHAGHGSLIKKSIEKCDKTIVSVFVNPTQFGINEDFSKYPRTLEQDKELAEKLGADVIFAPSAEEMYGTSFDKNELTVVCPPYDLVNMLCGKARPGHFDGVSTVVVKLLNITMPDYAFFGEKDAQQLFIIKKVVKDLNINTQIIPVELVRDKDNLALSSRNKYLTKEEREKATSLYKVLLAAKELTTKGYTDSEYIRNTSLEILNEDVELEYFDFIDEAIFQKTSTINKRTRAFICAKVGSTRLIDNMLIKR